MISRLSLCLSGTARRLPRGGAAGGREDGQPSVAVLRITVTADFRAAGMADIVRVPILVSCPPERPFTFVEPAHRAGKAQESKSSDHRMSTTRPASLLPPSTRK